ncbi:MAG: LAGLIDADG family homing endonuclease [bacterium]|nr:LAGLIDADG family homing endonuclease [bacterium]
MGKVNYSFDPNMALNRELCEFVGAFIGDAFYNSYQPGKYVIQFTGDANLDNGYYNNTITPITKKLFGMKPYIRKKKNTLRVNFQSKILFYMLKERFQFPQGKKVYFVKIPKEIISGKKEFIYATIRGIFDTDGCVYFDKRSIYKKPYPRITLQIANEGLFLQLKALLSKYFEIYTSKRTNRKFYIEVYGHEQLKKWMLMIGFSNPRHLKKINASVA